MSHPKAAIDWIDRNTCIVSPTASVIKPGTRLYRNGRVKRRRASRMGGNEYGGVGNAGRPTINHTNIAVDGAADGRLVGPEIGSAIDTSRFLQGGSPGRKIGGVDLAILNLVSAGACACRMTEP